tara:strand:- start:5481 stop:6581 length:1101 start_codon:yes stop_codon:yes gene_type:complete
MDISEAINEAVGSVLTEQENIVAQAANEKVPVETETEVEEIETASETEESEVAEDENTEEVEASDAEEDDSDETIDTPQDDYVNVPVLEGDLATSFSLLDNDGELEIPNVLVKYSAKGVIREDRLDKVVRFAQMGVANEENIQELKTTTDSAIKSRDELAQSLAEREEQLIRLLQEDDYYYNAREAFEKENSPEFRAERAEQKVRDLQVNHEMQSINNEGGKFFEAELQPAIGMLSDALPTVSADELAEKCVLGIQPYMELAPNGQPYIPSHKFDRVREYILEDLAYWAQLQHSKRSGSESAAPDNAALKKLEKARVEAQKAKRLVGQKTKPVGRAGKSRSPKRQRQAATVDDALESALDSVLSNI